jgi:hypothetical protein
MGKCVQGTLHYTTTTYTNTQGTIILLIYKANTGVEALLIIYL